jgi:hypothetical protein
MIKRLWRWPLRYSDLRFDFDNADVGIDLTA